MGKPVALYDEGDGMNGDNFADDLVDDIHPDDQSDHEIGASTAPSAVAVSSRNGGEWSDHANDLDQLLENAKLESVGRRASGTSEENNDYSGLLSRGGGVDPETGEARGGKFGRLSRAAKEGAVVAVGGRSRRRCLCCFLAIALTVATAVLVFGWKSGIVERPADWWSSASWSSFNDSNNSAAQEGDDNAGEGYGPVMYDDMVPDDFVRPPKGDEDFSSTESPDDDVDTSSTTTDEPDDDEDSSSSTTEEADEDMSTTEDPDDDDDEDTSTSTTEESDEDTSTTEDPDDDDEDTSTTTEESDEDTSTTEDPDDDDEDTSTTTEESDEDTSTTEDPDDDDDDEDTSTSTTEEADEDEDTTTEEPTLSIDDKTNSVDKIDHVVVLGERHSGLYWLQDKLKSCFPSLEVSTTLTRGGNWFQDIDTAQAEAYLGTNTLVIAVFLNPYSWVELMREKPVHMPAHTDLDWKTFLTKSWTTERPSSDLDIDGEGRICQLEFKYHDVVSCTPVKGPKDPIYELRPGGDGDAFENILDFRSAKIYNFLGTLDYEFVKHFEVIKHEDLESEDGMMKKIVPFVEEKAGLSHAATCSDVIPKKLGKDISEMDDEFLDYMNKHVDWSVEEMIGYEQISKGNQPTPNDDTQKDGNTSNKPTPNKIDCGCPHSCTRKILSHNAGPGSETCKDRILELMGFLQNSDKTAEAAACIEVSSQYPNRCGGTKCNPEKCPNPSILVEAHDKENGEDQNDEDCSSSTQGPSDGDNAGEKEVTSSTTTEFPEENLEEDDFDDYSDDEKASSTASPSDESGRDDVEDDTSTSTEDPDGDDAEDETSTSQAPDPDIEETTSSSTEGP